MSSQPALAPRASNSKRVVFIDGILRTGKLMQMPIVSSLERCEMAQNYPLMEDVPILHRVGLLSSETAIALLQREVDININNMLIGRRVNFRYDDVSGIWNARDPREYFQRIFAADEYAQIERVEEIDPIFPIMTHDCLCNAQIIFRALPEARLIWIRRNPIDVAFSWHRKRWGERIGNDSNSTFLAFAGPNGPVPWHALGWETRYEELSPADRIIYSIAALNRMADEAMAALDDRTKSQVFVVTFESVTSAPEAYVEGMCSFLATRRGPRTAEMLSRARVPRVLHKTDLEHRLDEIKAVASPEAFEHLLSQAAAYDQTSLENWNIDTAALRCQG